jgi:hypothetical protein
VHDRTIARRHRLKPRERDAALFALGAHLMGKAFEPGVVDLVVGGGDGHRGGEGRSGGGCHQRDHGHYPPARRPKVNARS